jgi:hypothetical protein
MSKKKTTKREPSITSVKYKIIFENSSNFAVFLEIKSYKHLSII